MLSSSRNYLSYDIVSHYMLSKLTSYELKTLYYREEDKFISILKNKK